MAAIMKSASRGIRALAALAILAPALLAGPPLKGFETYVQAAMKAWKVPGLAIIVVQGDRIVYSRGFGVRRLGQAEPVDERTLFAIGSATKTFTASLIGMLADEGKIRLDDPATRYLPGFQLADPYVSAQVTVRDLLTHRTGVVGGDLLWASGEFNRDEIVRRLRFIPSELSLRSRFDYSNIMVIAAGQALAAAAGKSWDAVVAERIFSPLGMADTITSVRDLPRDGNAAAPHDPNEGDPRPVPWRNMDNTAAAGGIISNVRDMAQWLRFHLRQGVFADHPLLSKAYIKEMQSPQTIIPREGKWARMAPDAHFQAYGLGWILSDYHGRLVAQHPGGIDGMSAIVGLLPEEDLGVVVLSNLNGNLLPASLMFRVFDATLGLPPTDWSARNLEAVRRAEAQEKEATERERTALGVIGTGPTLDLASYAGTYRNEAWGDAVVGFADGKLTLRYGKEFVGELEPVQHDLFLARWHNPARGTNFVNFTVDIRRQAAQCDIYLWLVANFRRIDSGGPSDAAHR